MKTLQNALFLVFLTGVLFAPAAMAFNVTVGPGIVGGVSIDPNKDIVFNLSRSMDHTIFSAEIKAVGLDWLLSGAGPFTIFAPTNAAFKDLSSGTVENWMQPENKEKLMMILKSHLVRQRISTENILKAPNATATFKTVSGEVITVSKDPQNHWWVSNSTGSRAQITIPDVAVSNGVIDVTDAVLAPSN